MLIEGKMKVREQYGMHNTSDYYFSRKMWFEILYIAIIFTQISGL